MSVDEIIDSEKLTLEVLSLAGDFLNDLFSEIERRAFLDALKRRDFKAARGFLRVALSNDDSKAVDA